MGENHWPGLKAVKRKIELGSSGALLSLTHRLTIADNQGVRVDRDKLRLIGAPGTISLLARRLRGSHVGLRVPPCILTTSSEMPRGRTER